MQIERILVPTDFSEAAAGMLERAVVLAVRHGAKLKVLHAEVLHEHDPVYVAQQRDKTMARVERVRAEWPTTKQGTPASFEFECVRDVSAYDAIMAAAGSPFNPDIIAMATHGGGLMMSSLAERVVHQSSTNVLTALREPQGNWPAEGGRILVPVDFSANSKRALEVARSLSTELSPITLVHVVESPLRPKLYAERVHALLDNDLGPAEQLEEQLREWAEGPVDDAMIIEGEVRDVLIQQTLRKAAVLVVIGAGGPHGFSERIVGTTAERVVRGAPCPVLTVR